MFVLENPVLQRELLVNLRMARGFVLLLLYPVVFLFGLWVQTPLLMRGMCLPFWLALFIGNVASVLILNYLVPWTSTGFRWWLSPAPNRTTRNDWAGAALIVGLYVLLMLVFSLM